MSPLWVSIQNSWPGEEPVLYYVLPRNINVIKKKKRTSKTLSGCKLPLMFPFMFNDADIYEEEEAAAVALIAIIAFISILGAREARNDQRRRHRRYLRRGELLPNPHVNTPDRGRGGGDDSGEDDGSMPTKKAAGAANSRKPIAPAGGASRTRPKATTKGSASDDGLSVYDDDDDDDDGDGDDDEPPPAKKRATPATSKKATQPFKMSESGSDVEMANDPSAPLSKKTPATSDGEDSEDDLIRAAPAKGKGKGTQAGKRKS